MTDLQDTPIRKRPARDLTGCTFGRLTVLGYVDGKTRRTMWNCACACGKSHVANTYNLMHGQTRSCGCLRAERAGDTLRTHGMYYSRTYRIWSGIIQRCTNPRRRAFKDYGGRGITVCDEWRQFPNFLRDMGEAPADKTIERVDNSRGYSPDNCCWATMKEQTQNTRRVKLITHKGKTQNLSTWAKEYGIPQSTLSRHLSKGIPFARAVGDE